MKKIILFLTICLSIISNLSAQTIVDSGTTGLLTWTLYSNGTLDISGNGDMPDYFETPWHRYSSNVKTIILANGITSIGSSAFNRCSYLNSITIPNSITSIGSSAFNGCSSLMSIIIPESVTSIDEVAFRDCSKLTSITVNWSVPHSINPNVFWGENISHITLYVPAGTKSAYQANYVWGKFNIVEMPLTSDRLFFRLSSDKNNSYDHFYLLFSDGFSESFLASEDAIKMTTIRDDSPVFWSLLDGANQELFVNALPMKDNREVRVGFSVPETGNYTISMDAMLKENIRSVVLIDKIMDTKIDLLQTSYSFYSDAVNNNNDRFRIYINEQSVSYTITASAGNGGSISPTGSVSVSQKNSQTFYFSPNTGYEINQVLVDGYTNSSAATNGYYTFSNVTSNHTISVSFKQKQYTITASTGSGGSISPTGSYTISHGNGQTFYFYPNTNYEINQVLVDGYANSSAVTTGYYTFSNVTANHTISVSFKQKAVPTYTITASAGSGGSISPTGSVTISQGNSQAFYFSPSAGYEINQVLVDGYANSSAVINRYYTFSNVTANHTISVSFKQSCTPNIVVQVWNDVLSVINNPANNGGYTFTSYQWQKNGADISGETSGNLSISEPDGNSYYSVRLTTTNGQYLQTCPIQLRNISGDKVSAYPNPTEGKLTIESAAIRVGDKISIYSTTGTLVRQFQTETKETSIINIASLEKGIYFIRVNDQQIKILKINK